MATDSIKLFHKALADQILAMEREALTRFLEESLGALRQKPSTRSLVVFQMQQNNKNLPEQKMNDMTFVFSEGD